MRLDGAGHKIRVDALNFLAGSEHEGVGSELIDLAGMTGRRVEEAADSGLGNHLLVDIGAFEVTRFRPLVHVALGVIVRPKNRFWPQRR